MTTSMGGNVNTNRDGSNDVLLNVNRTVGDGKHNATVGAFVAANDHRGLQMGTVGAFGTVNAHGHGASLAVNHTPKFNVTTVEASATANLWTSKNQASSLSAQVNASQNVSGPLSGHKSHGYGFSFNHKF